MKNLSAISFIILFTGIFSNNIIAQQWVTFTPFNTSNGLSSSTIYDIAIDGSGNKWFACYYGVSKFDGSTWTKYTTTNTSNGLAGDRVYCVVIDGSGNKWFGTDGGVSKLSGTTWTKYTTADGLVNNDVHSIAFDGSGNAWFGTIGGLSKFTGSAWTNYKTTDGLANNNVQAIAIDGSGTLWLGCYGGVSKFNGTTFTNYYQTVGGLIGFSVNAIAIDGYGNKIFGTDLGVSVFNGTSWSSYTTTDGLPGNDVRAIKIESGGKIWFGTTAGAAEFYGTNWITYTTTEGLTDNWVNAIALAPGGIVWFGCEMNGVSKFTPPFLTLSVPALGVDYFAGSQAFFEISTNTTWTLESDQAWLTSNKTSGSGNYYVTLTAETNPFLTSRDAHVTVTGYGLMPVNLLITQMQAPPGLSVDQTAVSLSSAQNSSAFLYVTSNVTWTVSSNQPWCSVTPTGGTESQPVTVIAQANNSTSARTATLSFSGPGVTTQTVEVTQEAATPSLSVSPSALDMGADAGSSSFGISSTVAWTALSNQSWLTLGSNSGSGDATITVNAETNSGSVARSATVTVSGAGVSDKTITITQAGQPFINVSSNTLEIDAAHNIATATKTFDVTSNSHWEASWSGIWFNLSANQGDGNLTMTITAEPNPTPDVRTGYIYFRLGNSSTPVIQTITITQNAGPFITVSPVDVTISGEANSTGTFTITTNTNWTVSSSYGVVTVDQPSGSGNATITLTGQANVTGSQLLDIVTVMTATTAGLSRQVNVTQETISAILNLSPVALNIGYAANSTASFTITSNIGWTISIDKNWLTAGNLSGTGNSTITLTADANPYGPEQTATVTVIGAYGGSKTVTVTQLAPVLTLDVSATSINIPANDNYQTTFSITSNTDWGVSSDSPWLTVDPTFSGGDKVVTITALGNYTGSARTARLTLWSPYLGFNKFVDVIQSITTGVDDIRQSNNVSIYPNPAHEMLNIILAEDEITVTISDLYGRKVLSEKLTGQHKSVNISRIPTGIYFIEIQTNGRREILRFVKD